MIGAARLSRLAAIAALVVVDLATPAGAASPGAESPACTDRAAALARLPLPLARMHRLVTSRRPLTVMALGSSSTAGAGASSEAASYPMRLQAYLRQRFPGIVITVVNRGVNGEDAAEMLRRFDLAALSDTPDVVLWQFGTNTVLRDDRSDTARLITEGLLRMRALGADVVLIDPQFAPTVLAKGDAAEHMVGVIAAASRNRGVDLFPRFRVMREWHDAEAIPFDAFLDPDRLHMNDWGYACFARLLGAAMAEAATRPVTSGPAVTPER